MHITMEHAEAALKGAREAAKAHGTSMCIAIVDSGASLKAFARMDDAWVGSIDIAVKKAKTAVFFSMPTNAIGELSQPGGSLYGIARFNDVYEPPTGSHGARTICRPFGSSTRCEVTR